MYMKWFPKPINGSFVHEREAADHANGLPAELKYTNLLLSSNKDVKWFRSKGCEMFKASMDCALEPSNHTLR